MGYKQYELGKKGFDQLIKDLDKLERELIVANDLITQELATITYDEVRKNAYRANEPLIVTEILSKTEILNEQSGKTSSKIVYTNSPKATFAEFGYGIVGQENPYVYDDFINKSNAGYIGYNIDTDAKKTDDNGRQYWFYRDESNRLMKSYGEVPLNIYYDASVTVLSRIEEVLKRRLGNIWGNKV